MSQFDQHYKESCPYQPMWLQFVSKSTIFAITILIVSHGTMVKMICSYIFDYKMVLSCKCNSNSLVIIIHFDKNEDEKYGHNYGRN